MEEELRAHIHSGRMISERSGLGRMEAERQARIEFGGHERFKEEGREAIAGNFIDMFIRDVRFAPASYSRIQASRWSRSRRSPLESEPILLFSVHSISLLRPLPFPSPDQLVRIYLPKNGTLLQGHRKSRRAITIGRARFGTEHHTFQNIVAYDTWRENVSFSAAEGAPEQMRVGLAPGAYFEMLGVRPIMGRLFTEEENQFGHHYVAAIDVRIWKERYAGSNGVLGQKIFINDEAIHDRRSDATGDSRVDGAGQTGAVELWTPFASATEWSESARGARGDAALGRLKTGVSLVQAEADLSTIAAGLAATHPIDQGIGVALMKLVDTRVGTLRPMLFLLSGAVTLILLIACLNLANLLLARNATRERELAMRAALGAARSCLIRQLLIEAALISIFGAAFGLGLAQIVVSTFRTIYLNNLPQLVSIDLDWRVVIFSLLLCLATTFFFGLFPALKATRQDLVDVLKKGGHGGSSSYSSRQLGDVLVVTEMAISLMLILMASLLIQSIARLERQSLGIRESIWLKDIFICRLSGILIRRQSRAFATNWPGVCAACLA